MKVVNFLLLLVFNWVTEVDAQELFNTVRIGNQEWMTTNLATTNFTNGDTILQAKTSAEWANANALRKPVWCFYNNDSTFGKQFGLIYNWYAIIDKRGLAPNGFHIPESAEWEMLVKFIGGIKQATKIKSKEGWKDDMKNTNSTNFSAVPGGFRLRDGSFYGYQQTGALWSVTNAERDETAAYYFDIDGNKARVIYGNKSYGSYVRCIKN